jgi:ABC-type transport system involved in multi-copper enzyme maturation permease subunit
VGRTYAIALNAYREAIRDRVLFGVLGLAAASLLLGSSLAWLSIAEQVRIIVDHGMVTISWLSNLVAVFLGASFLYKEIELRTLYVILARPIARWEFVLGKYLGIVATAAVFIALTASMLLVLLDLQAAEAHGTPRAGVAALSAQLLASRRSRAVLLGVVAATAVLLTGVARRWKPLERARSAMGAAVTIVLALLLLAATAGLARAVSPDETRYVLLGSALVAGEVTLTAAIAMLFSSFSTPFVTGMLTLGMFLVGRSAGAMIELRARQVPIEVRDMLRAIATVVPNLQLFVPSRQTLLAGGSIDDGLVARYVLRSVGYAALYAALLLALASWLFRRRDLT